MFLAGFVVTEKLALEDVLEEFVRDDADALRIRAGTARGEFQGVVGGAGVAVGARSDAEEDVIVCAEIIHFTCDRRAVGGEPTLLAGKGAGRKFDSRRRRSATE